MTIKLKTNYKDHRIGQIVSLSYQEEKDLVAWRKATLVEVEGEKPEMDEPESEEQELKPRLHASDMKVDELKKFVESSNSLEEVYVLLDEETEGKARESALKIIDDRIEKLAEESEKGAEGNES